MAWKYEFKEKMEQEESKEDFSCILTIGRGEHRTAVLLSATGSV